jgi:hypothetical protein
MTKLIVNLVGCDSSVGIATRYGLDGLVIGSGGEISTPVQFGPGAHPSSYTIGSGSFLGVKRPARGTDHPPRLASRLKEK